MDSQLKLHGGRTGNLMLHHPLGASLGALALAAPCTWIASGAEGVVAGAVLGLVGLVMGAPLGAMLADSAMPSRDDERQPESGPSSGARPRHH